MDLSTRFRRRLLRLLLVVTAGAVASLAVVTPAWADDVTVLATGGALQTARVNTTFATSLTVTVTQTGGQSPEAGVEVTFSAPSSGASGTFSNTGTNSVSVSTDSQGQAIAPMFTANSTAGSYDVTAVASTGPSGTPVVDQSTTATFYLTNNSTGVPNSITAVSGDDQSTNVGTVFASELEAEVTDTHGNGVPGVIVSFSVEQGSSGSGANFASGGGNASASTESSGVAVAPTLTANETTGPFVVVASATGVSGSASFDLTNIAGAPHTITAGAGRSQSTAAGTAFAIPLSVTVLDSYKNAVSGVSVTFKAPTSGASGTFASGGSSVTVSTDSNGIAVAPTFTANSIAGGYVVDAEVTGVSPVAFPLVNQLSSPTTPVNNSCTDGIGNDDFLCTAYSDLLGRVPDSSDLAYWDAQLAGGASRSAVAYDIVTSAEYRSDLISGYYQAFLGRGVDTAGLWYWLTQLNAGASDQSVIAGILGSAEFYTESGGTPDGFITALYTKLLGRAPDAGGLAFWEGQLSSGATPSAVAAGMLSSTEYQSDYVEALYSHLLGRTADAGGLSYWVAQLAGGVPNEFVISAVVGSAEFYADATA